MSGRFTGLNCRLKNLTSRVGTIALTPWKQAKKLYISATNADGKAIIRNCLQITATSWKPFSLCFRAFSYRSCSSYFPTVPKGNNDMESLIFIVVRIKKLHYNNIRDISREGTILCRKRRMTMTTYSRRWKASIKGCSFPSSTTRSGRIILSMRMWRFYPRKGI